MPGSRTHAETTARDADPRMAGALLLTLLLAPILTSLVAPRPALAQAFSATTYAEFDLAHDELVASSLVPLVDSNPGQSDDSSIEITGSVTGSHGDHSVLVRAQVTTQPNGAPRLEAYGEHLFDLGGSGSGEVWFATDSTLLARATLSDELTIPELPPGAHTVELYWDVNGFDDAEIDIAPSEELLYDFFTQVRLDSTTSAGTGGGSYLQLVPWPGGVLAQDLDDRKFVSDIAMTSFTIPDSVIDLPFETSFEVEPHTSLMNEASVLSFSAVGQHVASFEQSADLIGVIIRDEDGDILPALIVLSASGFVYPVLDQEPVPGADKAILSPETALGTDLGEYDASVPLENTIDQSGLDKAFTSGVTDFDDYFFLGLPPYADAFYANNWQSDFSFSLPIQGHVDYDLGATYLIDRVALWNRNLENVRILVADDPIGPWQELGAFLLDDKYAFSFSYDPQILDLGGEFEARYLRLQIDSTYLLSPSDTFGYAILGEIAVSSEVIPVPEPGVAWMASIGGLALGAIAVRRRSSSRRR